MKHFKTFENFLNEREDFLNEKEDFLNERENVKWSTQDNEFHGSVENKTKIGKLMVSINSVNLKLRLQLGNQMVNAGGDNNRGIFKNLEQAKKFVDDNYDDLLAVKSMNSLLKIGTKK